MTRGWACLLAAVACVVNGGVGLVGVSSSPPAHWMPVVIVTGLVSVAAVLYTPFAPYRGEWRP